MNDVQWEILIENQRRNLENPEIEECLKHAKEDGISKILDSIHSMHTNYHENNSWL